MAVSPRVLAGYTGSVIAIGAGVIAHSLVQLPGTPRPAEWAGLGLLALIAARFALKLPGVAAHISISDTFFLTSALLFGPAPATVTIALDSLVLSWRRRHRLHQLLFNPTSSAVSLWCGAYVYATLAPAGARAFAGPATEMILPLGCMAAVYFLLNSGLTCLAIALAKGEPPFDLWRRHFAVTSISFVAAASAAFSLVVIVRYAGPAAAAGTVPLLFVFYLTMRSCLGRLEDARRHVADVNQLYLSTIGAFATAIEAKDGVTSDHIYRVRAYAMKLARAAGVTDAATLQALEAAALLHDTGKLSIPEHILNKPGALTAHEYETMKLHVEAGAEILESIDFPYPVVPIVRCHHENWDGSGYPAGLRGDEIPIAARILSVVDCYDALTSERPYRRPMTDAEAVRHIVARRGSMYDPAVVDCFAEMPRQLAEADAPRPELQKVLRRHDAVSAKAAAPRSALPVSPAEGGDAQSGLVARSASADKVEDLLPFVSLAHVGSADGSVVHVARLAWGLLRAMAPTASVAFYVIDHQTGMLQARFTAGAGVAALADTAIPLAERVSGWVAATRRSIVNSDAALDVAALPGLGLRYAAALPLLCEGAMVGVLTFYTADAFDEDQIGHLELVAPHIAQALARAAALRPESSGQVTETDTRARAGLRLVAPIR